MDYAKVLAWIEEEAKTTRILEVTDILLQKLTEKMEFLAVVFYDMEDDPTVEDLQVCPSFCLFFMIRWCGPKCKRLGIIFLSVLNLHTQN